MLKTIFNKKNILIVCLSAISGAGIALAIALPIVLNKKNNNNIFDETLDLNQIINYTCEYRGSNHNGKFSDSKKAINFLSKNYNQQDLKNSIMIYINTFILPAKYNNIATVDYLDADNTYLYIRYLSKTINDLYDIYLDFFITLQRELTISFDSYNFNLNAGDSATISIYLQNHNTKKSTKLYIGDAFTATSSSYMDKEIMKGNNIELDTQNRDIQIMLNIALGDNVVDINIKDRANWVLPLASNYSKCEFRLS